ncbi:hypothetical protein FGG78_40415 [Thioclava sp. BHET1]|nr:hypothetical protein FGG78_40415 [Thioclava sp. BHET1]
MTPALVNTPVLETERLILRAPQATDFDAFASFMAADRSFFVRSGEIDRPKAWRAFGHMTGM